MEGIYILLGVLAVIILLIICNIKVVPQAYVYVIERFGAFHAAWGTGLHWKIPLIEKVAKRVSIKEQVVDFQPQSVITKDNVTMQIDTVVFFQITNAMQFTYGVERPISAIENLTATTLRNIVGDLDLEATLTSRDIINTRITAILDEATDRWGIKVQRVELKNILPPREIQDAMERQMKADRERREQVIQAEADKKRAAKAVGNTITGTVGREVGKTVGGKFGKFGKTLGGNVGASLGRGIFSTLFSSKK